MITRAAFLCWHFFFCGAPILTAPHWFAFFYDQLSQAKAMLNPQPSHAQMDHFHYGANKNLAWTCSDTCLTSAQPNSTHFLLILKGVVQLNTRKCRRLGAKTFAGALSIHSSGISSVLMFVFISASEFVLHNISLVLPFSMSASCILHLILFTSWLI